MCFPYSKEREGKPVYQSRILLDECYLLVLNLYEHNNSFAPPIAPFKHTEIFTQSATGSDNINSKSFSFTG